MQVKTSELIDQALNWAVAQCVEKDESLKAALGRFYCKGSPFEPSTAWSHGGPIINREHIGLISPSNTLSMFWTADIGFESKFTQFDHDPLVAAMRCYVASKLGDTVEIPDELC